MTEREKLEKKKLLMNYAERIGLEFIRDYGSWVAIRIPDKAVDTHQDPEIKYIESKIKSSAGNNKRRKHHAQ